MASGPGSDKKAGNIYYSADDGEENHRIGALQDRIDALEGELRQKREIISAADGDRRRAEDALRESEERFRNVFENVATGILIADANRGYLAVNDRFCEITGYTREELLTMGCAQIVHPDDQAADIAGVRRLVKREAPKFIRDLRYVHASGRTIWARVNVSLMHPAGQEEPRIIAIVEDVTERKRAEDALRESEERYRELVESANSIILRWDLAGRVTFFNEYAQKFFGYGPDEVLGKSVNLLVPATESTGRDLSSLIADIGRQPELFKRHINENVRKNGERVWVSWTNNVIRDPGGNPVEIFAVGNDITDLKQAEDALSTNERFLNNIFNCIQDGLSVLSKDLSVIRYNPTIEKWHGKDLTGKKCYRLFHGREEPCENCPSIRAIREKTMQREVVHDLYGWKEIYAYPLIDDDGKVTGTIEQVRDITGLKRAGDERERLLKDAEEQRGRLQAILEALPAGVCIADAGGGIVLSNDMAKQIFGQGVPRSGSIREYAQHMGWWTETGERVRPEEWGLARAVLKGELSIGEIIDIQRGDGTRGTIFNSAAPVRDADGNVIGGVVIFQDITRRRQIEDELDQARTQAELYLDLMGHDINNMHQIALGYLELARDAMPRADGPSDLLDKPVEVLQRSARLIQNVRKLQRLREGVFPAREVDVVETIARVRGEFGTVPGKAISVNLNGYDRCRVRANELLYDVFANLVSNAIKHTGDRADIAVGLDVIAENGCRHCRVSVEDNGPGIPDDFKPRLFDRMLKGTSGAKGMGLGLYLVKSLVASYDGRVWVEDRVPGDHSKGARFVVILPAVE